MSLQLTAATEQRWQKILDAYPEGRKRSAVIPMLIYAQDETGIITREVMEEIARRAEVSYLQVEEVVGFYSMLRKQPLGKYHIQVCTNISCMLVGGMELWQHACQSLHLGNKQTSTDGLISIEEVECMGACAWAPAIEVNYDFHHHVTPARFDEIIGELKGKG